MCLQDNITHITQILLQEFSAREALFHFQCQEQRAVIHVLILFTLQMFPETALEFPLGALLLSTFKGLGWPIPVRNL